jgi:hypothetical protein
MVITTHELQTSDVRHLHCSDPRVADEVAAVNRSLHRLDESVPPFVTPPARSSAPSGPSASV